MKICLLLIDCLRPDHLGCYGYSRKTSPNIDAIARKGIQFSNAYAQSNWTYPSVYSMMTGRCPSVLNVTWFNQKIHRSFRVLPELLAQRGYHTGIFSNFKVLLNPDSFCSHFQEMREVYLDDAATNVFREWIRAHEDSFLLFHTGEFVHEPFCANADNVNRFLEHPGIREEALQSEAVQILTSHSTTGNTLRQLMGKINKHLISISQTEREYLMTCYDAGIYQVDRFVGEFHRILQEEGGEYLFIVSADHGEAFMEHHVFGHGFRLYEELIRVPLIIDFPDCVHCRVEENVQLMDIFPSLLDVLQIEQTFKTDGSSFAPAFRSKPLDHRLVVSEGYPNIVLIQNRYKLISSYSKYWDREEISRRFIKGSKTRSLLRNILSICSQILPVKLYNLDEDPGETVNVRWRAQHVYQNLHLRLKNILSDILKDTLPSEDIELNKKIEEQLKNLGYI